MTDDGGGMTEDGSEQTVEELLGIAVGCIGMSVEDFCRCAPLEFEAVMDAWAERETRRERGAWERLRMECLCTLQPYAGGALEKEDVMRFAWDEDKNAIHSRQERAYGNGVTREETVKRYREVLAIHNS